MIYRKNNMTLRSDYNLIYRCEQCPCDGYYIGFFCSARVTDGADWNNLGEYVYNKETETLKFQPYPIPDNPFTGSDGILYPVPAKQAYHGKVSGYCLLLFNCLDTGPLLSGGNLSARPFTSLAAAQEYMHRFEDSMKALAAENCRVCTFRFWQDYLRLGDDPEQNVNAIDITLHGQTFKLYFSGFTNNGQTEYSASNLLNASIWTDYQKDKYGDEYLPEITDNGKSYAEAMGSAAGSPSSFWNVVTPDGIVSAGLTQVATFKSSGADYWNEDATPMIPEGASLATWEPVEIKMEFMLHIDSQRTDYSGYTDPDRTKRNYFKNLVAVTLKYDYECSVPPENPEVEPFKTISVSVKTTKYMRSITKNSLLLTYPRGVANNAVAGMEGPWIIDSSWNPTIPESHQDDFFAWYNKLETEPTWEQIRQQIHGQDWIIGLDAYNTADRITMIYYRDAISGGSSISGDGDNTPTDGADQYTIDRIYWENRISTDCNGGTPLDYFMNDELPEEFE